MTPERLSKLAAAAGDTISPEAATIITASPAAAAELANFYSFRRLELVGRDW